MSEEVKQAVADETKVSAVQDTAADSAQGKTEDDLDVLLNDPAFKEQPAKVATETQPELKTGTDQVKDASAEVLAARDEIRQERFHKDMNDTIEKVRGNLDSGFFDKPFVKAWIDARATDDPRLAQAWVKRHQNPQEFNRVVGALSREFAKKYGRLPDKQVTEDTEAVAAAVRGASNKVPEGKAPDFSKMSDAELNAHTRQNYGF